MTPAGYKRSIYLPRELWARVHRAAKAEERTVSQWISIQLRDLLDLRDLRAKHGSFDDERGSA